MEQRLGDYRLFWREFRRTFHTTGAVLPSGRSLARSLTRYLPECDRPRQILEVGPGTGAVTHEILKVLSPGDRLVLVERNQEFVDRLAARLASDVQVVGSEQEVELIHASVEELSESPPYDAIVSGLPLNNFAAADVERLLAKMRRLLRPGGTLSFFEYIALRRLKMRMRRGDERRRLVAIDQLLSQFLSGNEVSRDRVLANVPPAWVHHVRFE